MGQWEAHPWHFAAAAFQMFAAKIENGTAHDEATDKQKRHRTGGGDDVVRTAFDLGGDLHLPPMDYWALIGGYLDRKAKSLDQASARVRRS
jgi:hypothetical protein